MEKLTERLDDLIRTIENQSIAGQRSDFTGWNLVEAIESIGFELKRWNDREEGK